MGKRKNACALATVLGSGNCWEKKVTVCDRTSLARASRARQFRRKPAFMPDRRASVIFLGKVVSPRRRKGSDAGIQYSRGRMKTVMNARVTKSFNDVRSDG